MNVTPNETKQKIIATAQGFTEAEKDKLIRFCEKLLKGATTNDKS